MTTDHGQDHADEQAVQAIVFRLQHVPDTYIADPHAWARKLIADMRANGWYCRDRPPERPRPDPETAHQISQRGGALARELLTRKDHHDAR